MESDSTTRNSIASLVSGIISDLGDLVGVELRIAKAEFEEDLSKLKATAFTFTIAAVFIGIGALLLLEMLVQLLHVYTELPLWSCYGIVGFCSAIGGGLLLLRSRDH